MAVQDQLSALAGARNKIAQSRNKHMLQREEYFHDLEDIDLALGTLKRRIENLTYQREECRKSAKALSAAWLGGQMPESIAEELKGKQREMDHLDAGIKHAEDSQVALTEHRGTKNAGYNLEAKSQEKLEAELKVIDQRITEIRGF